MPLRFSICICTRNRADLLLQAVRSVARQTLERSCYEILVVDNASTDHTAPALAALDGDPQNLRVAYEPCVGLSVARNRAAQEAAGEWLAYLDDDALAPPDWLEQAEKILRDASPDLLGGPFYPSYTTTKPAWYRDVYGSGEHGRQPRWLEAGEYLFGGNLFIQRAQLLNAGGFPTHLGMRGARLFYGEETRLQQSLRRIKPELRVYYAPELAVRHRVAPEKMRLAWRLRQRWMEGRSGYLTFRTDADRVGWVHVAGFLGMPAALLWSSSLGLLLRDRARYPAWQNYVFEVVFAKVAAWGKLYERLRRCWFDGAPDE